MFNSLVSFEKNEYGDVVTKEGVGTTPGLDPKTWITEVATAKPHWFGETVSMGSTGSNNKGAPTANPYAEKTRNVTEQIKLESSDPKRAEQLKKLAQNS